MANSQLLSLIISAVDRASSVIGKVQTSFGGLKGSAQEGEAASANLSNAIAWGMAKAQIAIASVERAYNQIQGKFQEAGRIELENLSTASGLDALVGGFDQAAEVVDRLNSTLAKNAAALPGATADYTALARTISDDVAGAFKDANGKIADLQGFESKVASLSTSYGAMAAASGVSGGNMQLFLMKALGGTASQAELMQIDALQKNAQLRSALDNALKKAGVDSLKELSTEKRIKLLDEVGKKVITPEFLKRSQDTVEGMWQSFISSLFDPMGGVFGLMRDLEPNIKGQQTAFESIKKAMSLVIGEDGLISQLQGIMEALGLTVDPMRVLRDGVEFFNGMLSEVITTLSRLRMGLESGANLQAAIVTQIGNLQFSVLQFFSRIFGFDVRQFEEIGEQLGYMASRWVNQGLATLNKLDYGQLLTGTGAAIGHGLNTIINAAFAFLAGLDYGQIGTLIGSLVLGLFRGLFALLATLDWKVYIVIAAGLLISALLPGIATFAAGLVATAIAGLAGAPVLLIAALVFVVGALAKQIIDNWDTISAMVASGWAAATGAVGNAWNFVTSKISDFFAWIGGLIESAKNMLLNNPIVKGIGSVAGAVVNGGAAVGNTIGSVGSAIGNVGGAIGNVVGAVMPKFDGHIPNAANGLLSAAAAEAKAMPTGAQVVVANDSEYILKPTGKSANVGGNTFNFTISGGDPQAIADEVIARIQAVFEAELNSQLV